MTIDEFVLPPDAGKLVHLGKLGVRFMLDGEQTDGRFALVGHRLPPRSLGSAMHTHHAEDEFSFVLEGQVGFQMGDRVLVATSGTLVMKPRGVPHAFWNPSDAPARVLELISPAGFERYFAEMADLFSSSQPDPGRIDAVREQYQLEVDLRSVPFLIERYGLSP
jgi:mannose-6-phosphate isomerase-like protein (cupin superfamily)